VRGFGDSSKYNEIRIENRRVGAGVRITGDHPLSDLNLWSIRTVPGSRLTDAPNEKIVRVERQMRAVIFDRADKQNDHWLFLRNFSQSGPAPTSANTNPVARDSAEVLFGHQ
jgi:hypothetical protein